MWAPVFISEQCVKREQQNVKFKSRCAVSNVGVIWWGPGDWSLFRGDLGYALVLGGGVHCSSPASPWSCLCISLEASGVFCLGSAPLQLKQLQWVIGLCSSSSFLPCPYSVEFIFSDFKQKESLCLWAQKKKSKALLLYFLEVSPCKEQYPPSSSFLTTFIPVSQLHSGLRDEQNTVLPWKYSGLVRNTLGAGDARGSERAGVQLGGYGNPCPGELEGRVQGDHKGVNRSWKRGQDCGFREGTQFF